MAETLTIPDRFNGPLESGNGGYVSGAVAELLGGVAEVSLRSPAPLDRPLDLARDNGTVRVLDGETLIAMGTAAENLELEIPAPVGVEEAREAAGRYRGVPDGLFARCFVCGPAREDGFGVFAGEVEGRELVASPWTPPAWTAGEDDTVRPEFVWSVLDCPTYFAAHIGRELTVAFLANFAARIDAPVTAGEEHVVIAWPVELDGRKLNAGSAVLSADGQVLARARALLIAARE